MQQHSLDVIMHDATGVEKLDTTQKRFEPNFGNGFVNLDRDETRKVSPGHEKVSTDSHKLMEEIGG